MTNLLKLTCKDFFYHISKICNKLIIGVYRHQQPTFSNWCSFLKYILCLLKKVIQNTNSDQNSLKDFSENSFVILPFYFDTFFRFAGLWKVSGPVGALKPKCGLLRFFLFSVFCCFLIGLDSSADEDEISRPNDWTKSTEVPSSKPSNMAIPVVEFSREIKDPAVVIR